MKARYDGHLPPLPPGPEQKPRKIPVSEKYKEKPPHNSPQPPTAAAHSPLALPLSLSW